MLPPTKRTGPALVRAVPVALIALAALAVVAASLVPVPDLALAASKPGLSVAPSHTTPGHRVTFTGRLAPHRKRPIVLQRRAGGHWRTVESTHTKHSGRFKVRTRAPATTTIYRVHAKKVRRHGKVVKKVSTGTRRVQVATTHTPTDSPTTAPPVDTTAPPVPTGVTAVPTAAGAASISWEPVVAGDLEGYQVYQAVGSPPGPWTQVTGAPIGATTLARTGLSEEVGYTYRVTAVDSSGNESAPSATTSVLPARPTTQKFLAVYARASDQVNDPTHPGKIRATLEAVNGWFATQTTGGVQPRFQRRSDDEITVQSVVLDLTAAEFAAASFADERASINRAVHPAADTKLVVVIDAAESSGCGITGSDVTLIGESTCNIHTTSPATWPAAATYLVGHEMTHNFGAASSCAPHADGSGHVTDDNRDVIWTGSGGRDFGHLMLDVGHDDYYGLPGGSPCYDIQDSPYWTDTSDPLS